MNVFKELSSSQAVHLLLLQALSIGLQFLQPSMQPPTTDAQGASRPWTGLRFRPGVRSAGSLPLQPRMALWTLLLPIL